jgi:phage shock protein A
MHNKTISKILVAIIMTSMLIAIVPTLPVSATALTGITPVSGNVGTVVRVVGTIDTQGGSYSIYFDTDDDGNALNDGAIKTGNAPANSYAVNDTFTVPPCLGSDSGNGHLVLLRDEQTLSAQSTSFAVITKRTVTTAAHNQEGDTVAVTVTVSGGTVANTVNNYTVGITNPSGTTYIDSDFSFTSDGVGSGSVTKNFPSATFTTGANTNLTGTYTVQANRTLPGIIAPGPSTSFTVGLTDKTSYGRFETVDVQTAGWANNQNVTITIRNPSGGIVQQWANQNLTTGMFTGTWLLAWNATMGTYTVTAVNATGNNKAVASTQTFTVGSANLAVAFTVDPAASYARTNIVNANFTIRYPDTTLYNTTHFSSIVASVYYNNTMVGTVTLTAANYNSATGTWRISWKIPRNAVLGNGYKFTIAIGSIADTNGNTGPTAAVSTTTTFAVTPAVLAVKVTQQPAINYTRTSTSMAKINITYPDNTFFTAADLGSVLVRVYRNATNVANVTLDASNFSNITNDWAIQWASPYNALLGSGYNFTVLVNEAKDITTTNMGPIANVTTNNFDLLAVAVNVASIQTDDNSYSPGEYVRIFFDATYPTGTPVITGTSTVTLTAPDTFSTITVNPVHTSSGRWQVTVWLSDAQAQVGAWNVTLAKNGLNDGAGNTGPAVARTTSFTVLPAEVTLEDIMAAIDALSDKLNAVEGDTSSVQSQVSTLYTAVNGLGNALDDLQTQLDSLSATSATTTEVAAVSSAVSSLSSDLNSLEAKLTALQAAVANAATDSDVAAVKADVAGVNADIAALETKLNTLNDTLNTAIDATATPADVDASVDSAVSDLSDTIGGVNTLVIVAVVLSLIAAAAAIAAVYIIQRKIAG